MYFPRFALFALSAIVPTLAVPQLGSGAASNVSCPTGFTEYCCDTVVSLEDLVPLERQILSIIGLDIDRIIGQFGFTCQKVNIGSACYTKDTCCQSNLFNGFVAFPCRDGTPVSSL